MYFLITALIFLASVLLILIVLVQNSKGGGLASNFSGGNQVMGVRKTADFLEKATWGLAISLLVLSLLASMTIPRDEVASNESMMQTEIENAPDPTAIPDIPAATNGTSEDEVPDLGE